MAVCSTTSQVLVDRYLKGRAILLKKPMFRRREELAFLQAWLPENIPLFKEIPSESLRLIARSMTLQSYFPGEVIYEQDDPVFYFHVILRGSVSLLVDPNFQKALQATITTSTLDTIVKERRPSRVTKKDGSTTSRHLYGKEVNRLFSGNHFGEEALLQTEERAPHTVRTDGRVEVMAIHVNVFNQCLHSHFQEIMLKRAEFLADLEYLRHWTPHLLRQLAFMLQERRYHFGDCLYRQEMHVPGILFIQSGSIRISTHSNKQAPEELVSKIDPPKDYLPEILAEDLQEETTSKVSVFSTNSKQLVKVDSHVPITPASSRYTSANSLVKIRSSSKIRTYSLSQNRQPLASVSSSKGKGEPHKKEKKGKQFMGFIIHHPSPATSTNICILGPGDTLCDMEAICKLKKHLFNAVCESDVVIYELDRFHFELMFEKRVPHVLYQMSCRAKQRVESWGAQYPGLHMFKPLLLVLEQIENRLVTEGAHKLGRRKKPLYTPTMLAFTAIKGLGKSSLNLLQKEESSMQIPNVQVEPSQISITSPPPQVQTSPFPLSPFEPRVPDFERLASMMLYSHPRFKGHQHEKNIFDSPAPVKQSCGPIPLPNADLKNAIPTPVAYPTQKTLNTSLLLPTSPPLSNKASSSQGVSRNRDVVISMGEIFTGANEPQCLSKIRMGILFGKNQSPSPPKRMKTSSVPSDSNVTMERPPRAWRSKSAGTSIIVSIPPVSIPRPISYDGHSHLDETGLSMDRMMHGAGEGTTKTRRKNMKTSFSVDNELTSIPNEYSNLFKMEEEMEEEEECLGCGQGSSRSHCKSCPPFVKTMEHVIENRTSYMLTKYRLSLAISGATVHKKTPQLQGRGSREAIKASKKAPHHIK